MRFLPAGLALHHGHQRELYWVRTSVPLLLPLTPPTDPSHLACRWTLPPPWGR